MNLAIVIGRLGKDPELKYTTGGKAVAELSIATSEKWRDAKGELQERVEWHRVTLWDKQAENAAKYLSKGSQACVRGRIQTEKWTDNDGTNRYTTKIIAEHIEFLGSATKRDSGIGAEPAEAQATAQAAFDDIPF